MKRKIQLKRKVIIFVIFFTFSLLLTPFIILSNNSSEINLKNHSDAEIILSNNSAQRGGGNEQSQSQNISPPKPNTQNGNVFRKDWNWTGWYNGSVDPTSEGWTLYETMDGQGAQWDQYNGIINISTISEGGEEWYYNKSVNFDSSKGYTINFRMKVNDPALTGDNRNFQWMDGQITQQLSFQQDMISLDPGSLSEGNYNYYMITDDKYHDYWICSKNNFTRVWLDNVNVWNFTGNAPTSINAIGFGDINPGANGGETLWNYIRWYEEGEILPWHETGIFWTGSDTASWREWRNDFDYIYFLTQTYDKAVIWKHPTIVKNDCYERQAIVSNGGGGKMKWKDYAFAELAINDELFDEFMAEFCAIADLFKDSSGLRAFVIGDELPGSYFNTYMERFVLYDTPSFNFTELNKTYAGRVKIAEWATEKNAEALNRIYYYMKEYLDGYDIEIYQAPIKIADIICSINNGLYNSVNFSKVIGDGYGSNCYLSNKVLDNWQFLFNEKLFYLNRYATLYPNKPHFMFIEGSEYDKLLTPNKTILEKSILELCSVTGNIHFGFFTACHYEGMGMRNVMIFDRENDYWKPKYEDIWNLIREASAFCRSQPILTRKPQDIVYIIPHYQKYYLYSRFLSQSPAFWIPRTINYDVYSTKEILNNFNEKPINDYALVIISCCHILDQEELDLIRSWDETWKIWICRAGYFTENNTERGWQSFWDISNETPGYAIDLSIDATGIGMSFDYTIPSTGYFGHFGNCSFDENGKSLVSLYNDENTYHLLVKYTDGKGFGEYWLGNYLFFCYEDQCNDLFSAIIEWCLEDRGFYPTKQKFLPNRLTLSSDADNPDDDGRFTLKWVESLFADNYSVYTSDSYITEITDDLTLIGKQEADQPYFSSKTLNKDVGVYYYIVEAHNKYGSTISNCIMVDVLVSELWNFTTGDMVLSSPALGDVDGSDTLEVIVGSLDGKVYALNGEDGSELWNFTTGGIVYSSPALGDVDSDGKLEVVVGSYDYKVYVLSGEDGSELWNFTTGNMVSSSPALGDVDGDGKLEVVVGSSDHNVYVLNGEDGSELWSFATGNMVDSSPALGDVDGDGKLEVVFGSYDEKVYVLNGEDGSELWSFATGVVVLSSPALGDVDDDGKLEVIVISLDGKVYALNGQDGSEVWSFATGNGVISSPALGDVDGDGKLEVVFGSYDEKVHALNGEDGSELWSFTTKGAVFSSPALGGIGGDGKLEVIVGSLDGKVYALNGQDGSEVWSFITGDEVYASAALGDVDGDGQLEVVVGSYDHKVYALKPKPWGEMIAWQGLSGDSDFYRTKNFNYLFGELYQGFGMLRINGQLFFGAATLSLSEDTIQMEIENQIITWDVVCHSEFRYMEIYIGEGELGWINVIVIRCGSSTYVITSGTGVFFLGST